MVTDHLEALPRTWLKPGESFLLTTVSGARTLLVCATDHGSFVARIGPEGEVRFDALFGVFAVAIGPNYLGEPALVTDRPARLNARARYFTNGRDEWWTTSTVVAIESLPAVADRGEFEALAESFAEEAEADAVAEAVRARLSGSGGSSDFDEFVEGLDLPDDLPGLREHLAGATPYRIVDAQTQDDSDPGLRDLLDSAARSPTVGRDRTDRAAEPEGPAVAEQRARTARHLSEARERYPYLFDIGPMAPEVWLTVHAMLAGAAGWSEQSALLWVTSPCGRLINGALPVDLLTSDPEAVLTAARHAAAGPP